MNLLSFCGKVRLEVTWRDVGIRLRPLSARLQYKVGPRIQSSDMKHFASCSLSSLSRSWMMRIWWR